MRSCCTLYPEDVKINTIRSCILIGVIVMNGEYSGNLMYPFQAFVMSLVGLFIWGVILAVLAVISLYVWG